MSEVRILAWKLRDQIFGLDLAFCKEVVADYRLTHVPHAPAFVGGIVNLRGEVLTVIELGHVLGYDERSSAPNILISLKSSERLAVGADSVLDVIDIQAEQIEGNPAGISEVQLRLFRGMALTPLGVIAILHTDELLSYGVRT